MPTTWKDIAKKKLTQGDWSLIIANLIPVIGVWFFNWSAKEVFLVYCLETIIIGLFTLLKLLITGLLVRPKDVWQNQEAVSKQPFWFFMLFFYPPLRFICCRTNGNLLFRIRHRRSAWYNIF